MKNFFKIIWTNFKKSFIEETFDGLIFIFGSSLLFSSIVDILFHYKDLIVFILFMPISFIFYYRYLFKP